VPIRGIAKELGPVAEYEGIFWLRADEHSKELCQTEPEPVQIQKWQIHKGWSNCKMQ
jgi:hypothetical protein